jgi:hypothetical protein
MTKDTTFLQVLTPSSGFLDYAISMRPDYHQAIIDVVRYYGWRKIIYLYDSHDGKYTSVAWSLPINVEFCYVHCIVQPDS